jgi:hypothetical protein
MKTNAKNKVLTFGDFIAGAYRTWGARRAKGLVRLAVDARLVEFQGPQRLVISEKPHENQSYKTNAQ